LRLADGRVFFVKSGAGDAAAWLAAEARGLAMLAPHLRVPRVCGDGELAGGGRWLALEWLELVALDASAWEDLGRQLAGLHRVTAARHGLDHDNFIGATPQSNRWTASWPEFFLECRIRPQLALARRNGHAVPEAEVCRLVESALAGHEPPASLVHGDLWSGNAAALAGGGALVFDPAPYHGDAETDLAMLELFGGPLPGWFFRGYGPPVADRGRRRPVYDLYHALNHLNLFGGGYAGMVRAALAAAR
jgi:fructosamine-3-kinase